jgi:hypothetical protein
MAWCPSTSKKKKEKREEIREDEKRRGLRVKEWGQ